MLKSQSILNQKELKTTQSNVVNLIDVIELFSPDKKSKYTDLLLRLMKNTKSLKEHSQEVIENITNNFDFLSKEDFDGYSEIQILLIFKFLDSFFNVSDLNNFRKFCEYNERGLVELNDLSRYKNFEDIINQMNMADLKAESKELENQIIKLFEDKKVPTKDKEIIYKAVNRTIADMESDGIYFSDDAKEKLKEYREEMHCEYSGLPSPKAYEIEIKA